MKSKEPKQEMKQFFINPAVVAEWAKVLPQIQVDARRMSLVLILLWVGSISTSHDKGIHATFHTIKTSLL